MINKKIVVVLIVLCLIGVATAIESGLVSLDSSKIISDTTVSKEDYVEMKTIFVERNVVIDDKIGLDIDWTEKNCNEVRDENNLLLAVNCEYALYKTNLFGGAIISVSYPVGLKESDKLALLDKAILDKVDFVTSVWKERNQAKEIVNSNIGVVNIKEEKIVVK